MSVPLPQESWQVLAASLQHKKQFTTITIIMSRSKPDLDIFFLFPGKYGIKLICVDIQVTKEGVL